MPCSPLTSVINLLWSIVMENKTKQVEFFEFLASHFKPNTYFLPTVESHNYIAASKESSTHSFIHCSYSRVHASWYLLKFFCFYKSSALLLMYLSVQMFWCYKWILVQYTKKVYSYLENIHKRYKWNIIHTKDHTHKRWNY